MRRIILIPIILHISFAYGQLAFDSELLSLESKIYNSSSNTVSTKYCIDKLDLYIKNKNYGIEALNTAERIDYDKIADSAEQIRFLWNAALIAHLNNDQSYAPHYIFWYQKLSNDNSIQANLLAVVINNGIDSVLVSTSVKHLQSYSKEFDSLICINGMYAYRIEHKKKYTVASAIVPGLGIMLNGNVTKGVTSLALTGATGYTIYLMAVNSLYFSAILTAYAIGAKFYLGNIALTKKLVLEKEELKKSALAKNCKCTLNRALERYPLRFK